MFLFTTDHMAGVSEYLGQVADRNRNVGGPTLLLKLD